MCWPRLIAGKKGFAVMQIDLDYFKAVNDSMGHARAIMLLQAAARVDDRHHTRDRYHCPRRGDEFTVLLPGITDGAHLTEVGNRS